MEASVNVTSLDIYHRKASKSVYGFFEIYLAITLYLILILGKILLLEWANNSFISSAIWKWLLWMNIFEAIGWIVWIIIRHGTRLGPVLLLLPLACFFYTNVPIFMLSNSLDIYPFPNNAIFYGMWLQSAMSTHLWLFVAFMSSKSRDVYIVKRINSWLNDIPSTRFGKQTFFLLGIIFAAFNLANFYISGAADLVGNVSRAESYGAANAGDLWILNYIFVAWSMTLILIWNSTQTRLMFTKVQHVFAIIAILIFLYPTLRLGSRREIILILLFYFIILCLKGRAIIAYSFAATLFIPMAYLGLIRGSVNLESMDVLTVYIRLFGEFVNPHFPLLYYITRGSPLWLGWSYVRAIGIIIPTLHVITKPQILAALFAQMYANGSMGYAYTPLGEGYANFGSISILVVPMYLIGLERILTRIKHFFPVPLLVFLATAMDINRGEFATIISETIIFSFTIYLLLAILKINPPRLMPRTEK